MVRTGSANLEKIQASGAIGRYLDNVRINYIIFLNNVIERIDATNINVLIVSISIIVVELYIRRYLSRV